MVALTLDEIFEPGLLAKFVSVPIYNDVLVVGQRSESSLRRQRGK